MLKKVKLDEATGMTLGHDITKIVLVNSTKYHRLQPVVDNISRSSANIAEGIFVAAL